MVYIRYPIPSTVMVSGLFVPQHFRSRERKVYRENFHSRGTVVPGRGHGLGIYYVGTVGAVDR